MLCLDDVLGAMARIRDEVHQTPLLRSERLDALLGCEVHIKAEHLQKTGSFKARGACHFVKRRRGGGPLTTYSSGNHGQAVAWACLRAGLDATVFVPEDVQEVKRSAILAYKAAVVKAGHSVEDRRRACEAWAAEHGDVDVVPPFDHEWIMAGQGTVMTEVLEQQPMFDSVLVPVGGGGLLAGCAVVLAALRPRVELVACEPEAAADAVMSLQRGHRVRVDPPQTVADGLRHQTLGQVTYPVIASHVTQAMACSENSIGLAMGLMASFLKQVVEPSGAVALACLLEHRARFQGKRVVLVATGGNVDLKRYASLVASADIEQRV